MREEVGYTVKDISDKAHKELTPAIIYQIFEDHYVTSKSIFQVSECHFRQENCGKCNNSAWPEYTSRYRNR